MAEIFTPFGYPVSVALREAEDMDPEAVAIVAFPKGEGAAELFISKMPLERVAFAIALLQNHLNEILSGNRDPQS